MTTMNKPNWKEFLEQRVNFMAEDDEPTMTPVKVNGIRQPQRKCPEEKRPRKLEWRNGLGMVNGRICIPEELLPPFILCLHVKHPSIAVELAGLMDYQIEAPTWNHI